jgi:hypothetical protein
MAVEKLFKYPNDDIIDSWKLKYIQALQDPIRAESFFYMPKSVGLKYLDQFIN